MSDPWTVEGAEQIAEGLDPEELAATNGQVRLPPIPPERFADFRLTDEGVANFMVWLHGDEMRYVDGLEWITWDGTCWRLDGKEMHRVRGFYSDAVWMRHLYLIQGQTERDAVNQFMRSYETNAKMKGIIQQAQRQCVAAHEEINADLHLLNCRNGVINLKTRDLMPHDPSFLQTKQTPGDYVRWADLPDDDKARFYDFLSWACDGDESLMRLVCRCAGYSLTGDTSEEVLFLLFGTTRSGKSTLSEGLASVMGYGYSGAMDATILTNSRQARGNVDDKLAGVAGCRLVNCAEPPRGERFTESLIKTITSGDRIRAAFKFVTAFEFAPRWKIWISTNHTPGSEDRAVHRRLVFIPFRHTVPKNREDPSLKEWIRNPETGGRVLLSWAVEGAFGYYNDGGLRYEECAVAQEWKESYEEDEDPVGQYLLDSTQRGTKDPDTWPGTKELYSVFERWFWRERQSTRTMSFQAFNHAVEEHGLVRGKHPRTGRRVWKDISLTVRLDEDINQI